MIIQRTIIQQLFVHAERETPIEACGYLAGTDGRITRHYPMTNIEGRIDHFSFSPEEQFAAIKAIRKDGLTIIAVYHSHPASPARPSAEDIKLAYDSSVLYVIVSLMEGARTIKGYSIRDGRVEEESITIEEDIRHG